MVYINTAGFKIKSQTFAAYIPLHWRNAEMSLLSARHKIIFTFLFLFFKYFFAAAAHPTPCRESVKRLINSSWPDFIKITMHFTLHPLPCTPQRSFVSIKSLPYLCFECLLPNTLAALHVTLIVNKERHRGLNTKKGAYFVALFATLLWLKIQPF